MKKITLGCEVKDTITGFQGIVYCITEWLNGCVRIGVQPQQLHEGKPVEPSAFDIEQMEYVGPGVSITKKETGGDRPAPTRAKDPTR